MHGSLLKRMSIVYTKFMVNRGNIHGIPPVSLVAFRAFTFLHRKINHSSTEFQHAQIVLTAHVAPEAKPHITQTVIVHIVVATLYPYNSTFSSDMPFQEERVG